MGTITVNVDDETEQLFRKRVKEKYGQRKGALGKAFTEAMEAWSRNEAMRTFDELLDEGVELGYDGYDMRGALHDRR